MEFDFSELKARLVKWLEAQRKKLRKSIARRGRIRELRKQKIAAMTPKQLKKYKAIRAKKRNRVICRSLLAVLTALAVLVVALLSAGFVAFRGPSQSIGDLLTVSMLETSALKFVPRIYYDEATLQEVIARNSIAAPTEEIDTSMVEIAEQTESDGDTPFEDIELCEVKGATYHGYMLIVKDPSRVHVGTCKTPFNQTQSGMLLSEIAEKYDAVAAVNGGGFPDSGGVGKGGCASGLTISYGEVLYKNAGGENITAGFDENNKLIIGEMNAKTAEQKGIRDCCTYGPALIINGEPMSVSGSGSGMNPRTAIGQRKDGAVLLLVIEGRSTASLGATLSDLINIMLEYGAVNACNMDGGSSSMMYYNGEYVNEGVILTGSRNIPTAFIVT